MTIQLGPLTIPAVFLVIAGILGIMTYCLRFIQKDKGQRKIVNDKVLNSILILFIFWKISPVITSFSSLMDNPLSILYLPGNIGGIIGGTVVAGIYLFITRKKIGTSLKSTIYLFCALFITASLLAAGPSMFKTSTALTEEQIRTINTKSFNFLSGPHDSSIQSSTLPIDESKPIILNFWASWCPPCRAEIPELNAFYLQWSGEANLVAVNSIRSESSLDAVNQFVKEHKMEMPILLDTDGSLAAMFEVTTLPTTIIIFKNEYGYYTIRHEGAITEETLINSL